jgi:hypothetical protein
MCCDCNDIEIITSDPGYNGWSPVYANIEETCTTNDVVIQQLISWVGGTGTKPSYNNNIMTDSWLAANPLYLGNTGWVDTVCEATNIIGTSGTNGTNGSNGSTGAAGTDGCNPDITFNITAGSEEIACTVTAGSGSTDCEPIFDVNIPDEAFTNDTVIDTITSSTEFTTAVNNAVSSYLSPSIVPVTMSIGSSGTPTIRYTISGGATLALSSAYRTPHMNYIQIGNRMTIDFCITLKRNSGGPVNDLSLLEIKIPNGKSSISPNQSSSIGFWSTNPAVGTASYVITTNNTDSSYLVIRLPKEGVPIPVISDDDFTFQGQITITTN